MGGGILVARRARLAHGRVRLFPGNHDDVRITGINVAVPFHMLSALEAVNGALLFGISTAFLFAVIQVHWQLLSRRHEAAPPHSHRAAGRE